MKNVYEEFLGEEVAVHTTDYPRPTIGILKEITEQEIVLETHGGNMIINRNNVLKLRKFMNKNGEQRKTK